MMLRYFALLCMVGIAAQAYVQTARAKFVVPGRAAGAATMVDTDEVAATTAQQPAGLPCPSGVSTTDSLGNIRVYLGVDPARPSVCVATLNGVRLDTIFGYWPVQRLTPGRLDQVQAAVRQVLVGPVGTTSSFKYLGVDGEETYRLRREADEKLAVSGSQHDTLRIHLLGGYQGKEDDTLWVEKLTRLPLKSDGNSLPGMTWEVTTVRVNSVTSEQPTGDAGAATTVPRGH